MFSKYIILNTLKCFTAKWSSDEFFYSNTTKHSKKVSILLCLRALQSATIRTMRLLKGGRWRYGITSQFECSTPLHMTLEMKMAT